MKNLYYAWVSNDQGAQAGVPGSRCGSKRKAADEARRQFGSGWTVHIMQIHIDGDGQSVMGEDEIQTFRIR